MRNKLTKDEQKKFKRDCISFLDKFIDYLHEDEINDLTNKDIILQNYISIHETKKNIENLI